MEEEEEEEKEKADVTLNSNPTVKGGEQLVAIVLGNPQWPDKVWNHSGPRKLRSKGGGNSTADYGAAGWVEIKTHGYRRRRNSFTRDWPRNKIR